MYIILFLEYYGSYCTIIHSINRKLYHGTKISAWVYMTKLGLETHLISITYSIKTRVSLFLFFTQQGSQAGKKGKNRWKGEDCFGFLLSLSLPPSKPIRREKAAS